MTRLEQAIASSEEQIASAIARQMEAEKSLVAATHQRDQARTELRRIEQQFGREREEIARLHADAEAARQRAADARREHAQAVQLREAAETENAEVCGQAGQLCARISRRCRNKSSRVARNWQPSPNGFPARNAAEQHLTAELALACERVVRCGNSTRA